MWSNLLSAALLYGTTIVVAEANPQPQSLVSTTSGVPNQAGIDTTFPTSSPTSQSVDPKGTGGGESGGRSVKSGSPGEISAGTTPSATPLLPSKAPSPGNSTNVGAIAGGVVGGVLFLALVGALIFILRRRKKARGAFGSMEKSADERAANYESPSPLPPAPAAAVPESPHSHQNPAAPNEAHALMSHYGDTQPQHMPQEVQPVIMPAKPYDVNSSSREIRDDDDGISINGPSPVTTPSPERQQEQQRSVPRLPIYQGGGKGDAGGDTPPPAL